MLNEKMIAKLEEMGANRWTKNGMDRLYINIESLGYTCSRYNSGNVSSAAYKGEKISNSRYSKLACAKSYIDIADGTIHTTSSDLREDLEAFVEAAEEAVAAEEAEEAAAEVVEEATTEEATTEEATTEEDTAEEDTTEEDTTEENVRYITIEKLAAIIAASDCWTDTEEANEELVRRAELEDPAFESEEYEEYEEKMYRAAEILGVEI